MSEDNQTLRDTYRDLTLEERLRIEAIKEDGQALLDQLGSARKGGEDSRELAIARTKVEEAVMWATKHITA